MAIDPPPKVVREIDSEGKLTEAYRDGVDKMLEWMTTVAHSLNEAIDQIQSSKSDQ